MLDLLPNFILLAQQTVELNFRLNGIIALIAGILILVVPRLLNYVVALYLILIGLVQVFNVRV
jgi:hypothetical protein